jgi:hypothetical protein
MQDEESRKDKIHAVAQDIIDRFKDTKLYGEPIDMNDLESVVIAAYYLGWADGDQHTSIIMTELDPALPVDLQTQDKPA